MSNISALREERKVVRGKTGRELGVFHFSILDAMIVNTNKKYSLTSRGFPLVERNRHISKYLPKSSRC